MSILVKMLNSSEIENLRQEFSKIDTDQSGLIEIEELQKAL